MKRIVLTVLLLLMMGTVLCACNASKSPEAEQGESDTESQTETKAPICLHLPHADDGNCLTAVTCKICSKELIAAKTEHEAEEDDGDCTTPVVCTACGTTVIREKEHDFTGEWQKDGDGHWHICRNEGCAAEDERTAHTYVDGICVCGAQIN